MLIMRAHTVPSPVRAETRALPGVASHYDELVFARYKLERDRGRVGHGATQLVSAQSLGFADPRRLSQGRVEGWNLVLAIVRPTRALGWRSEAGVGPHRERTWLDAV